MYLNCTHTIKKIFILLYFFSGIFFCARGAAPDSLSRFISYRHFGEEDGLNCKTVYESIQEKDGFIWFATDAGAFRFDGKKFKQYSIEHGVTDKEVLKIFQDSYGRIWFLTLNGYLSFWKDGKIYNPSNTPFLKKAYTGASIFCYYQDTRHRIWLGNPAHVYIVIDKDSVRLIKCPYDGYEGPTRLGSIYIHEDAEGNMWSFSNKKMFRFPDNKTGDTLPIPELVGDLFLCHGDKSTESFYRTEDGDVYKISDKSVSLYVGRKEMLFKTTIINMVYDEGNLWLCTRGHGCFKIEDGKFSKRYFTNSVIMSVFRDRENNLWFNTMGEGIYLLPSGADLVKNYNEQSGLSSGNVTSFASDIKGEFWLGYINGATDKIENNKLTTFTPAEPSTPDFNRVLSLAVDGNTIFCGTDIGAYIILGDKVQFAQLDTNPTRSGCSIKQILITKKGDVYATHSFGLAKIIKTKNGYFIDDLLDTLIRSYAVTQYPDDRLLFSATGGIFEYIPGQKLKSYETDIDFSSVRILDMKPAPGDLLALATNGNGIYFLKEKKLFQHITTINGLSDNNCKRIFVTNNLLYAATDKGLNVLSYENERWKVVNVITAKNGLPSNNVNDAAERGGVIYVATEKGFSELNKEIIFRKKYTGKAYVTEIITDSIFAVTDSTFNFQADIPRLLIKFSYPVFDPSNDSKISYRLLHSKTDNADWTSSENNEVEFSSLNPGQYIFQLKPDAESVSPEGITNLYITIVPLWWQTSGARMALAVLIIVLVAVIIRAITRIQYRRELRQLALLETERSRIASDMHDDIGADLTQLSVWSGILKSSQKKDTDALEKITNSSNDVLQKMDQIIWALDSFHNHTTDLISYLREYASQYLESTGINLLFKTAEAMPEFEVSAIEKRNIFLTLKELLHNTVKHSAAKNVSINIHAEESILNIAYNDDGKGFIPKEKENGMGNITVQNRMKEINSRIVVQSSPGKGFSAHLSIRLKKKTHQKIAE